MKTLTNRSSRLVRKQFLASSFISSETCDHRLKKSTRKGMISNKCSTMFGRKRIYVRKACMIFRRLPTSPNKDSETASQLSLPLSLRSETENGICKVKKLHRSSSQHSLTNYDTTFSNSSMESNIGDSKSVDMKYDKTESPMCELLEYNNENDCRQVTNSINARNNFDEDWIKYEDNIFDSLCQSDQVFSGNLSNDLLLWAKNNRPDIETRAFLEYIKYNNNSKSVNNLDEKLNIKSETEANWKNLSKEEKLPFLLQAYISDYMPGSV